MQSVIQETGLQTIQTRPPYLEWAPNQEGQTAMTALSRTHLYGRHLVLAWATDNEEMDLLKEKAKRDIEPMKVKESQNKRIKFND
jgi:multiple RNA-binding domain-containing protein 1